MSSDRINTRLPEPLAEHVARMAGPGSLYETPSEYIRDLIRRDMEKDELHAARQTLLAGYRDLAAGRTFESTGSFHLDRERFAKNEARDWR